MFFWLIYVPPVLFITYKYIYMCTHGERTTCLRIDADLYENYMFVMTSGSNLNTKQPKRSNLLL